MTPPVMDIVRLVADAYRVSQCEIQASRKTKRLAHARQVAMYLCRELSGESYPEIGRAMRRHHSTVIHGVQKIRRLVAEDPGVELEVYELRRSILARTEAAGG